MNQEYSNVCWSDAWQPARLAKRAGAVTRQFLPRLKAQTHNLIIIEVRRQWPPLKRRPPSHFPGLALDEGAVFHLVLQAPQQPWR